MVRTCLAARSIALIAIAFAATACANNSPGVPAPATLAAVENPTPLATANATRVATLTSPTRAPITTTGAITLTLWTTEDLAPGTSAAGRILRNQFDAFTAAYPNIHIDIVLKKPYGKGGMLDFLTMTSAVVPGELPDLATLDISEVPPAANAGILQPLDPLLNADVKGDFFPFAYQAAMYQGKWVAVPFTADIEHLVYNKTLVKRAPQTWDDVLKQKSTLLLPAGGDNAFLVQYLALAPLFDANNQFAIDANAASQVLNFFKRARDLGLVPDTAIGLKSSEEAWPTFVAGKVAMDQVSASRFLADRDKLPDAQYAALPTRDGRLAAVATGWSFVIVAKDPTREVAAARFVQWIVQGEHLAPWLRSARRLPASRSTLILSVDPVEYATFLRDPLEHASYVPPSAAYGKASEAWRAAMTAVWKGQTTPEEAARSIAAALK
jgi:ABC-type glycerol-3-phosphate transport system substrate-binding protein